MNDFVLLNQFVTFPDDARQGDQELFQILVLGDNFIETNEEFAVNISTVFSDLIGEPGSAIVTIIHDGDSKTPSPYRLALGLLLYINYYSMIVVHRVVL